MHKHYSPTYTLLLALLFGSSFNTLAADNEKPAAPLKLQNFAYGMPLNFAGDDAVYQATLPIDIYQHTVRGDLGDLRVFNAQGEIVPHMLRKPVSSSTSQPTLSKLVIFPLQGGVNSDLDQLSLRIKRNASGTLIDINSNAKPPTQSKLSGYLLDASSVKQTMQALELAWPIGTESVVGALHIESSDDLKNWHTIVQNAPVASLQFGGHSLLQKRIELPPTQAKYLRLSWPHDQKPILFTDISAELSGEHIDTPLSWYSVKASAVADKTGEYRFDLGGHLPVHRMRIELPQTNTLVQAALLSKANISDAWQTVSNNLLYKLHSEGQNLSNPDININSNNNRYWLLRVEQSGGGLGEGLPEMNIGWQPQQLLFVTRGTAPFQLAYGSSEIKPAAYQMQSLLPNQKEGASFKIQAAKTGQQYALGGDARLLPAPLPHPWKKWILWAVLGMAVTALGWMAYRLIKQMELHDKAKTADK